MEMDRLMLETAVHLAREAGRIARGALAFSLPVSWKGRHDLVTETDLAAQRVIVRGLRERFPHHAILAEEGEAGEVGGAEWQWIIDPLDGTTNYARGMPSYCVSIALQHWGESFIGVVYDPVRDHLFHARRGEGAWLNGRRLRVSRTEGLAEAIVGYDWPRGDRGRRVLTGMIDRLSWDVIAIRSMGAAALGLCYVAAGWYDAYMNPELRIWDIAAGFLLVEEAGGATEAWEEPALGPVVRACLASNGRLQGALRDTYMGLRRDIGLAG
ncbi:MAG: inositol monophosphatase [Chloroflexi bacterium]|nr:inositol monophosphatase [Chloroflexota bacterium]